ncbi:MAG: flagellar filament protein [Rhodobacter sp. CACIA14H1]|nr:MAG: flagellar filament protein [Rhodobacter sp. CACIA14H1]
MTTINTNIGAIAAQANMAKVTDDFNAAMSRLSSGLRINAAKDDAAGMAIAEKMTAQVMGINQAIRNASDGKNMLDTTESAHVEVSNMLQRMRELAVQSANDTNTGSDRGNITAEARQLVAEINRIAENTTFNGMKVMDGSFTGKQFQIGADLGQTLNISIDSAAATDIGAYKVKSEVSIAASGGVTTGKQLIVSGHAGNAEIETTADMSAKQLAAEVNAKSAQTGVQATAVSKAKLSGLSDVGKISFEVNGQNIGTVAISNTDDLRSLRDAINTKTTSTGVTATMGADNSEIILTDSTGKNIEITDYTAADSGAAAEATMDVTGLNTDGSEDATPDTLTLDNTDNDATVTGQVTFTSTQTFSVNSAEIDSGASEVGFFSDTANAADLETVADIDLSTAGSSAEAITVIDVALQKISQARGNLGAMSNRLDSTISNLTNISVSVQAARSQVVDADFAKESTNLARGQILSQAATAMLAQANSSKQNVLSLLRG